MGIKTNTTDGAVLVAKLFLEDKENQRKHERNREERAYALVEKLIEVVTPVMAAAVESKGLLDQARIEREMAESELKKARLRAEAQKAEVAAERARYDFESLKSSEAEADAQREEFEARLEQLKAYNRLLEKRLDDWEGPTPGVEEDEAEAEAKEDGYW